MLKQSEAFFLPCEQHMLYDVEERPVSARLNALVLGKDNPSQIRALQEAEEEDEGSQCMNE